MKIDFSFLVFEIGEYWRDGSAINRFSAAPFTGLLTNCWYQSEREDVCLSSLWIEERKLPAVNTADDAISKTWNYQDIEIHIYLYLLVELSPGSFWQASCDFSLSQWARTRRAASSPSAQCLPPWCVPPLWRPPGTCPDLWLKEPSPRSRTGINRRWRRSVISSSRALCPAWWRSSSGSALTLSPSPNGGLATWVSPLESAGVNVTDINILCKDFKSFAHHI